MSLYSTNMNLRAVAVTLLLNFALMKIEIASGQSDPSAKAAPLDAGLGRIAWFDIATTNLARSKEFYGKLFGWTFKPVTGSDQTVEINTAGARIGTIRVAEGKLSPYNGVVYVQVNDAESSCNKAKELGATVPAGFPFNLPDGSGAVGLALDPSGHPIGLYSSKLLRPAESK
jgi:predicted enzyme related to lactoylglutathione lyase